MLPSPSDDRVGDLSSWFSKLNTLPVAAPVYASDRISRCVPQDSGSGWIRCSFPVGLFHSLLHAGLSRRTACPTGKNGRPLCHVCPLKMPAPSGIQALPKAHEIFLEQGIESAAGHRPRVANRRAVGPRAEDLVPAGVGRVFSVAAVLEVHLEIYVFH